MMTAQSALNSRLTLEGVSVVGAASSSSIEHEEFNPPASASHHPASPTVSHSASRAGRQAGRQHRQTVSNTRAFVRSFTGQANFVSPLCRHRRGILCRPLSRAVTATATVVVSAARRRRRRQRRQLGRRQPLDVKLTGAIETGVHKTCRQEGIEASLRTPCRGTEAWMSWGH